MNLNLNSTFANISSVHGYATRVFESISEKSAEAYEAYILALLKVRFRFFDHLYKVLMGFGKF